MGIYRFGFDTIATKLDAETAHRAAVLAMRGAQPILGRLAGTFPGNGIEAMGLHFPTRLGLAAGFDKHAVAIDSLAALGFGFIEIGTVTERPQRGNRRPRLFRLPQDRAIINRMGFNNPGAQDVAYNLRKRRNSRRYAQAQAQGRLPTLGINIGKSMVVPADNLKAVLDDYRTTVKWVAPYADYLVVNVSSPNTPGLRDLQSVERLEPLLLAVRKRVDQVTADRDTRVPLLVKIAPDLANEDVIAVAELAQAIQLDGIIAANTSIRREGLQSPPADVERAGAGGLSGAPLLERAAEILQLLRQQVPQLTLIGAGGIFSASDGQRLLAAGADLLQAYTGFIYQGPRWPRAINQELSR